MTRDLVEDPVGCLGRLLESHEVKDFVARFEEAYGIVLAFDGGALALLAEKASKEGVSVDAMASAMFDDYGHGLKLLGHGRFTIEASAVEAPKAYLDDLVKTFYNKS